MKKIFYILNLLFLTLLMFGGSVFAAAPPKQYIDADGSVEDIKGIPENLSSVKPDGTGNYPLTGNSWYYIDGTVTITSTSIYVTSGDNVNIVVAGNSKINFNQYAFFVPDNGSVSFWEAADEDGKATSALLTINGTYNGFVIGNNATGQSAFSYPNDDFGDITFNSGTYTIVSGSTGPAIGSATTSGGAITVNAAANLTAQLTGGDYQNVFVGVTNNNNNHCGVNVNGGSLTAIKQNGGSLGQINAGSEDFAINDQGYVKCGINDTSINPENIADKFVSLNSGVLNWYNYANSSGYNVNVGGDVTFPLDNDANLVIGAGSNPGTIVFEEGSNVQIGTSDKVSGDFAISIENTAFINNGNVEIVNAQLPNGVGEGKNKWTNNPGSSLTINAGQTLTAFTTNGSETTTSPSSSLTLNGSISGSLENYSNLIIDSAGSENGASINGPISNQTGGTATLTGTLNIIAPGTDFQNYGTLNIGPIGTVNGGVPANLVNNQGGTVTSQNPFTIETKYS